MSISQKSSSDALPFLSVFDPSCTLFAAVSTNKDNTVRVFETKTGQLKHQYAPKANLAAESVFTALAITDCAGADTQSKKKRSRDAGFVAAGTEGGSIIVWQLATGEVAQMLNAATKPGASTGDKAGHVGRVNDVVFDSTGSYLFSCGQDKLVIQWNVKSGEIVNTFKAGSQPATRVAVSGDGSVLAAAGSGIRLFDIASGKRTRKLRGHASSVTCLQLDQAGRFLLSSAEDRCILLWDTQAETKSSIASFALDDIPRQLVLSLTSSASSSTPGTKRARKNSVSSDASSLADSTLTILAVSRAGILSIFQKTGESIADESSSLAAPQGVVRAQAPISAARMQPAVIGQVMVACHAGLRTLFEAVSYLNEDGDIAKEQTVELKSIQDETSADKTKKAKTDAHVAEAFPSTTKVTDQSAVSTNQKSPAMSPISEPAAEMTFAELLARDSDVDLAMQPEASDRVRALPNADSLIHVLTQALHANDTNQLEACLQYSHRQTIQRTVDRLPANLVVTLLSKLITQFQENYNKLVTMIWVKAILSRHASYLLASPSVTPLLATLHQSIEQRAQTYKKVLALSGRLDLLLSNTPDKIARTESGAPIVSALSKPASVYDSTEDDVEEVKETEKEEEEEEKEQKKTEEKMEVDGEEEDDEEEEEEEGAKKQKSKSKKKSEEAKDPTYVDKRDGDADKEDEVETVDEEEKKRRSKIAKKAAATRSRSRSASRSRSRSPAKKTPAKSKAASPAKAKTPASSKTPSSTAEKTPKATKTPAKTEKTPAKTEKTPKRAEKTPKQAAKTPKSTLKKSAKKKKQEEDEEAEEAFAKRKQQEEEEEEHEKMQAEVDAEEAKADEHAASSDDE